MLPGWVDGDGATTIRIVAMEGCEFLGGHIVCLVLVAGYINDYVVSQEVHVVALVGVISEHRIERNVTTRNLGVFQDLCLVVLVVEFIDALHTSEAG